MFAAVIISTVVLMLSLGGNFARAEEKMMDKGMMMKHGDMTGDMMMEKGQMLMDKGKMMKEGMMDEDTIMKEGEMMMDKGKKMKEGMMK